MNNSEQKPQSCQTDVICGLIKIVRGKTSLKVQLPTKFIRDYNLKEVVFDWRKMTIREPSITDRKTFKITANGFYGNFPDELIGQYEIEKCGDEFLLNRT